MSEVGIKWNHTDRLSCKRSSEENPNEPGSKQCQRPQGDRFSMIQSCCRDATADNEDTHNEWHTACVFCLLHPGKVYRSQEGRKVLQNWRHPLKQDASLQVSYRR